MKKDFAKKKFAVKQSKSTSRKRWFWTASISLILVVVCGAGFFVYQPNKAQPIFPILSSYYQRINTWIAERKTRLNENLVKVKQIAVNKKVANQEIHFEFYTALQNMQVTLPDLDKPLADARAVAVINDQESAKVASAKKAGKVQSIFDADKLQLALQDEFKQVDMPAQTTPQYIIQMGVFKNAASAEKLRASFARSGFAARVVDIQVSGREAYSVQVGPFTSKNQALLAQRQLLKKNVNGIVRKI